MIMTERRISVADFSFSVTGDSFLNFMEKSGAFRGFFTDRAPDYRIVADLGETEVLKSDEYRGRQSCYEIGFEGIWLMSSGAHAVNTLPQCRDSLSGWP